MWITEPELDLDALAPAKLLWIVALSIEENGGPVGQVLAVRQLAAGLEDLGWWLAEPTRMGRGHCRAGLSLEESVAET